MKIVYRANDGKIFNTEKECLDYENGTTIQNINILKDKQKIIMYSDCGKILSIKDFLDLDEMLENVYKIIFLTDDAIIAFDQLFPFVDIDKNIELNTFYIYNQFLGKFIKKTDFSEIKNFCHDLSDYLSHENAFYEIIKSYFNNILDSN